MSELITFFCFYCKLSKAIRADVQDKVHVDICVQHSLIRVLVSWLPFVHPSNTDQTDLSL